MQFRYKPQRRTWIFLIAAELALVSGPHAQETGKLTGQIRGPRGVAVPGATVKVVESGLSNHLTTTSDETGQYTIAGASPGTYSLEVSLFGFRKIVREKVTVIGGQTLRLDFELKLATLEELARNSATGPAKETAGMGSGPDGTLATQAMRQRARAAELSAAAASAAQTVFIGGSIGSGPVGVSSSGVQQEQDLLGFGEHGGPTVNRVRGSIYESFGHSALDARPYPLNAESSPRIPSYRQSWGINLGGPLVIPHFFNRRNSTSIFVNYSQTRDRNPFDIYSTVPTPAERNGDFSQTVIPGGVLAGQTPIIFDPLVGQGFENNRIPAERIDPTARGLLDFLPEPNIPGRVQNFHLQMRLPSLTDTFIGSFGHRISSKDNLALSAFFSSTRSESVQNFPQLTNTSANRAQSYRLMETHTFNPMLVAQLMFNFHRNRGSTMNPFAFRRDVAGELGMQGISNDPRDYGVPQITFTNFTPLNDPIPSLARNQSLTFSAHIVWGTGNHSIKFGGEVRRIQLNNLTNPQARGTFSFTGLATSQFDGEGFPLPGTGFDLADFLLGLPQQTSVRFGTPATYFRSTVLSGHVQDDWKVAHKLTLNFGVTYEYFPPFREKFNHIANLDVMPGFTEVMVVTPGAPALDGRPVPGGLIEPDGNNFAPRFGLAFRPSNKSDWVLRAGYGLFHDQSIFNGLPSQLATQPPFAQAQTLLTSSTQPLTLQNGFPVLSPETVRNTFAVDRHFRSPYIQFWNLGFQKKLPGQLTLDLNYSGSRGVNQILLFAPNRAEPGPPLTTEERRSLPGTLGFNYLSGGGDSSRHGLNIMLRRQFSRGFSLRGSYIYAKALDNASSLGGTAPEVVQDPGNLAAERGLSSFDRRHSSSLNYYYELPFGEGRRFLTRGGWEARLLGNWQIGGGALISSGNPFTARVSGNASNNSGTGGLFSERADVTGISPKLPRSARTPKQFFNIEAFRLPPPGQFGNAGRNTIIGPGTVRFQGSLTRRFDLSKDKGVRGEFSIRATNLFNRPNFAGLYTAVNSSEFGRVVSAEPMRSLILHMRVRF